MSEPLNIMTEAEAKTKWCPFSRPVMPRAEDCGFQTGNRNFAEPGDSQTMEQTICLASACMAWRWRGTHISVVEKPDLQWSERTYGFCGLAGATVVP